LPWPLAMHFKTDRKDEHGPDNVARHKTSQQAGECSS
jgi:hypothetical protein